ncbi:MAG TPA: glycosyltransferase, partial [Acidimicrobiales bacterium]|nr:glycosyltransferase [Acidimicrobiales bacterium]
RGRYEVVHTHEEAGLLGPLLARRLGVPHVYDMGNDWTAVLENYGLSAGNPLVRLAGRLEWWVARHSAVVIAHFPALAERLQGIGTPVQVAYNVPLDPDPGPDEVASWRRRLAPEGERLVVYTGTLEPYQGVSQLLEAFASLRSSLPATRLVLAGGEPTQLAALGAEIAGRGLAGAVELLGRIAADEVPAVQRAADVLVSPRLAGSNTPLKLFSYLRAGPPVVATATVAHREVLGGGGALLVSPDATGLGEGLRRVLDDVALAARLRAESRLLAAAFSPESYHAAVAAAYSWATPLPGLPPRAAAATSLPADLRSAECPSS